MKAEWKQPWISALRSGEYQQGKGELCQRLPEGGLAYCCLGVLLDVCSKAGVNIAEDDDAYLLDRSHAPDLLGIQDREQDELARMNDNGDSFGVIADYIERNL